MKQKLLCFLLYLFFIFPLYAQDISGSWSWNSEDGGDLFTVDLIKISENNYRGSHCNVYLHGEILDCNDRKDEFTVELIRKTENIFQGKIRSGLSYTVGSIQLQYLPKDNTILFTLTSLPQGEFYIPAQAVMKR